MADLGEPIASPYSVPGGQAELFERGLVLRGGVSDVTVLFDFPMIGRPHIVSGSLTAAAPFGREAIRFQWPDASTLDITAQVIRAALAGRLALRPTGSTAEPIALTADAVERIDDSDAGTEYGLGTVSATALQERQLYDVVLRADSGWRVVAPHAVYARSSWRDFGLAHITDMHVARRIDSFPALLRAADKSQAAERMINWNDRFRGFIRFANFLHDQGKLDVIVATGDLYDYILELDDTPSEGGNAAFLRRLILGQAPGPDFSDVEELRVPIFLIPGNHDYRKYPYQLVFDIHAEIDWRRVRNFAAYSLRGDEARALSSRLSGSFSGDAPDISIDEAARMVEVDPEIPQYRNFLAPKGSYVVQLGPHRVAMLDTAHDVGIVTDAWDAVRSVLGTLSEDEATFVGGHPNCRGITPDALAMVTRALQETAASGLFIVGLHAPLFNPAGSQYPYFLRETQRPSSTDQAVAFVGSGEVRASSDPQSDAVARHAAAVLAHPTWFQPRQDHRVGPSFVKRVDSHDGFDEGVARGEVDRLIALLAGVGSSRAADLVLAGHTHLHNEFRISQLPAGELAFFMDFYTHNPSEYYPTKYVRDWSQELRSHTTPPYYVQVPVRDTTYVSVAQGAQPDAMPCDLPFEAAHSKHIWVPPYANPLSSSADPGNWWAQHRPVVLQTAALGPIESSRISFSGFRLLQVRNDLIERIHLISAARLQDANYRMSFEDAIRQPDPRRHVYLERSRSVSAPEAVGAPSGLSVPGQQLDDVIYRDAQGQLHEVWRGRDTGTSNLTVLAGNAVRAAGNPVAFLEGNETIVVFYRGVDDQVHGLYWSTGAVGHDALGRVANASKAASDPSVLITRDGIYHVAYRTQSNRIGVLYWQGGGAPTYEETSGFSDAPAAAGNPSAYLISRTDERVVAFRGADHHIHTIYWSTDAVGHDNLSGFAGSPASAGDPFGFYTAHDDVNNVLYRTRDGQIYLLWWVGVAPVQARNLTFDANAPAAASDPVGYYNPRTNKHAIYCSADGHIHDLFGSDWAAPQHLDLTLEARAIGAVDKPSAFVEPTAGRDCVVYRGSDNKIHEIRW